jgi:F-type H+-transporting ATPase subunit gamma
VAAIKEVRHRIKAVRGIQQVTKAMKMVAVVKMRRVEGRLQKARPYAAALEEIAARALGVEEESAPERTEGPEAIVVMGSDSGLCGGFNLNLFRHVLARIETGQTVFFTIGRKAKDYFSRQGVKIGDSYEKIGFPASWNEAEKIVSGIVSRYASLPLRSVRLAYQHYESPGVSRIVFEQWLPYALAPGRAGGEGIGKLFRFEPGRREVIDRVVARAQVAQFSRALLESQASEQGARMVAMDNATSNANDLQEELTLLVNKLRQWNITRELLEITTGVEARKN